MPRARRRKDTEFQSQMVKSVFLYGRPNKGKFEILQSMQDFFTDMVNDLIRRLDSCPDITLQLVKNDKKDSRMRQLEKSLRPKGINSAFCQNAFDMAVTHLSNRFDAIRKEMYADAQNLFTSSKVLFAMSVDGRSRQEMTAAMKEIASGTKKDKTFYEDCIRELTGMSDTDFLFRQKEFQDDYVCLSLEYRLPELKRAQVPLDSRLMTLEPSGNIKAPYVISVSNVFQKGNRILIPLDTSRHSQNKIRSRKMAGTVLASMDNGVLQIGWSYKNTVEQPGTSRTVGVDVGISDTLHTSDDQAIGSMKPVLDFYHEVVEPSFASLSDMRNKKKCISYYVRSHKGLPEDVRRSLIQKMDLLDQMIQKADAPYRKKRGYYQKLDHEIKTSVDAYIASIRPDTLTVLEKLDIKEFDKSRRVNGMMSTFARGQLQKKLMETLNWKGYDFLEIVPDYTSQVCPVCSYLDKENRDNKEFRCKCCGYEADADYVGSLNIKVRAGDAEILEVCKKYQYDHPGLQKNLKIVYHSRNKKYQAASREAVPQTGVKDPRDAA